MSADIEAELQRLRNIETAAIAMVQPGSLLEIMNRLPMLKAALTANASTKPHRIHCTATLVPLRGDTKP